MKYIAEPVGKLIEAFAKLPGIGPKTAQRLAFYIVTANHSVAANLATAIVEAKEKIKYCQLCGNMTVEDPCEICQDQNRNSSVLCVVEQPRDVIAIEKTGNFKGRYHVLHGALSPMEGIGANELNLKSLLHRVKDNDVEEVILATNSTVEGDTTALYLIRLLKPFGIKITRLAYGLSVGADLEYTDEYTLTRALQGRIEIE